MKTFKLIYKTGTSIFLMLLLFSRCDSWKTNLKADIDQESKDYCLFAEGSYWIYQDSATLETDSVIITNVSYEKSTHANPKISFLWEEYTMKTTCLLYNNIHYGGNQILTSKYCDNNKVEKGIIKLIQLKYRNNIEETYLGVALNYTNYNNGSLYENPDMYGVGLGGGGLIMRIIMKIIK